MTLFSENIFHLRLFHLRKYIKIGTFFIAPLFDNIPLFWTGHIVSNHITGLFPSRWFHNLVIGRMHQRHRYPTVLTHKLSLGLYSLSGNTFYQQISRNLEAAVLLSTRPVQERCDHFSTQFRGFEALWDLTLDVLPLNEHIPGVRVRGCPFSVRVKCYHDEYLV